VNPAVQLSGPATQSHKLALSQRPQGPSLRLRVSCVAPAARLRTDPHPGQDAGELHLDVAGAFALEFSALLVK
jgi:hypothetical protein